MGIADHAITLATLITRSGRCLGTISCRMLDGLMSNSALSPDAMAHSVSAALKYRSRANEMTSACHPANAPYCATTPKGKRLRNGPAATDTVSAW